MRNGIEFLVMCELLICLWFKISQNIEEVAFGRSYNWGRGEVLLSLPCSWYLWCCGNLCALFNLKNREWIFRCKVRRGSFCLRFDMRRCVFLGVWKGISWCCTHSFRCLKFTRFLDIRGWQRGVHVCVFPSFWRSCLRLISWRLRISGLSVVFL
jgi:hypothetical protein